jgi:hypothetical protein
MKYRISRHSNEEHPYHQIWVFSGPYAQLSFLLASHINLEINTTQFKSDKPTTKTTKSQQKYQAIGLLHSVLNTCQI